MEDISRMTQLELFSVLSEDQIRQLSNITQSRFFNKGDQIYQKGDSAGEMFVVAEGLVSLREIDPGDDIGIAFEEKKRGDFFGPASFMTSKVYSLTAVCLTDTEVLAINAEQLSGLCQKDSTLGYRLMKKIAEVYFKRYIATKRQICQMVKTPTIITALPG